MRCEYNGSTRVTANTAVKHSKITPLKSIYGLMGDVFTEDVINAAISYVL